MHSFQTLISTAANEKVIASAMTTIRIIFAAIGALICVQSYAQSADPPKSNCAPPTYKTVAQVAYPLEAILLHETGKAVIKVTVELNGLPTNLSIQTSSGFAALDQAGLSAVEGYTFVPATCDGVPTVSPALIPLAFSLHEFDKDSLKFAKDDQPLEFQDVQKEFDFLIQRPETQRGTVLDFDVFYDPKESLMWVLRKSSDVPPKVVMRIRSEHRDKYLYQNYKMACDGAKDWCEQQSALFLDFARKFPAPKNDKSTPS